MDTKTDLRVHGGADAYLRACPSRDVLEMIGSKWTVLIVPALREGPLRFGELRRRLDGITQKSLTHALRTLERDGLVTRTQYPTIPPRVEYALTDLGLRAVALLGGVRDWAEANLADVLDARAAFDARAAGQA
ncbi:winged helix-turn-helix transcriptional regulator [Krasilnikovia sp. MM14-A1004]|uniref:winged helix-turn-helix transcriptional regulator n=1 Tax=Krasilnikovia sp. MM14-A1004 TaxID=3373541 RepID=UPI00399C989D